MFCLEFKDMQVKSLVKKIEDLNLRLREYEPIDLVLEIQNAATGIFFRSTLLNWKSDLKSKFPDKRFKYIEKDEDGNDLYLEADIFSEEDLCLEFPCLIDERQNLTSRKPVQNFMRFCAYDSQTSESSAERINRSIVIPLLEASFRHDLTAIGNLALSRLEHDLLDRFKPWIADSDPSLVAPVVSLCQSSGSGKSKLSFELLKRHIGFYIVLRLQGQTGYPLKNYLSDKLLSLVSSYNDPSENLEESDYSSCTIGSILHFFAQIITRCVIDFIQEAEGKSLDDATLDLASKFDKNSQLSDCLMEDADMTSLYRQNLNLESNQVITVKMVSSYIKLILSDPKKCFERATLTDGQEKICIKLAKELLKFPFIFVVDEAEILAKTNTSKTFNNKNITGFEAFRRALSYLEPRTSILFLTLGTKSNVIDLNPDIIDESKRLKTRTRLPFPIILSSNLNIWSKKYPPHKIKPTFEMLLNPFYFKYLCTLGHGIWSSLPFSSVVNTGIEKIMNGTSKSFDYVLVLWMILTGMAANPLSVEAGTIVANHMGYLLDISDDLKRLTVMYPPEPMLAVIAHTIIDDKIFNEALFQVLQQKVEAADIDRGKTAELFGGMIILRAIWKSPSTSLARSKEMSYQQFQDHINREVPDMKDIWERNQHILQERVPRDVEAEIQEIARKEANSDILPEVALEAKKNLEAELSSLRDGLMQDFKNYKVHKVIDFLKTLLNISSNQTLKGNFPNEILDGLVNGTHMVNLDEFSEKLRFETKTFQPKKPKLADDRFPDTSRFIITESLLRLCINLQLIIKLPPGYFGLDYAIPVLLRDHSVTFIGVQIKRANANLSDDVYKMRSRLHFVRCPRSNCKGGKCGKCAKKESLDTIYNKQISIILSLDEEDKFGNFSSSTTCFEGCDPSNVMYLTELLKDGKEKSSREGVEAGRPKPVEPKTLKSPSLFKPLITIRTTLKNDIALSKSLWYDKHVDLRNIAVSKSRAIPFKADGFIHRQFCISIRGWNNFSALFTGFESCEKIAHRLMNPEGFIRHFPRGGRGNPDFIRKLIYDLSLTFPLYSEELRLAHGESSWLDELNNEVAKKWDAEQPRSDVRIKSPLHLQETDSETDSEIDSKSFVEYEAESEKYEGAPMEEDIESWNREIGGIACTSAQAQSYQPISSRTRQNTKFPSDSETRQPSKKFKKS